MSSAERGAQLVAAARLRRTTASAHHSCPVFALHDEAVCPTCGLSRRRLRRQSLPPETRQRLTTAPLAPRMTSPSRPRPLRRPPRAAALLATAAPPFPVPGDGRHQSRSFYASCFMRRCGACRGHDGPGGSAQTPGPGRLSPGPVEGPTRPGDSLERALANLRAAGETPHRPRMSSPRAGRAQSAGGGPDHREAG